MNYCYLDTPIGELLLAGDDEALELIAFPGGKMRRDPAPEWRHDAKPFAKASIQLREYFDGNRKSFELKLKPHGTAFQLRVLQALQDIPYGTTASYGEIARRIGKPRASRAVGAANGRNPLPIVIPCHRVVGSNGELTGFGGGIETKKALLEHERTVRSA